MENERYILRRIDALPEPRHLFVIPNWIEPTTLDRLTQDGYLDCQHQQRDEKGQLLVVMGLKLTPKAKCLLEPKPQWSGLVLKGSLAGASFAAMSVIILYLG
jgi:hypothetical protein